jgi:hypothetical protein
MVSTTSLGSLQLRDVQDALRKPLSGRSVLIPLGSKAFVAGELRPARNNDQEELVQLRSESNGDLETVARAVAVERIQGEIKDLQPKRPPPAKKTPSTVRTALPTETSVKTRPTTAIESEPSPAFFEIREEINELGEVVTSEAVDITQHLKLWEKEVTETSRKVPSTTVSTTSGSTPEGESGTEDEKLQLEARKVEDEEYAAIAARLDELARLEEDETAQKSQSRKSAKYLQSKGWSKGFLNRPSKQSTKTPVVAPAPEASSGVVSAGAPVTTRTANTVSNPAPVAQSLDPISGPEAPRRGRVVGFAPENQVREIPRVGQRSVKEIPKPGKPIQQTILSSVVRERPRQRRDAGQSRPEESSADDEEEAPRRLSRFAQQRMG